MRRRIVEFALARQHPAQAGFRGGGFRVQFEGAAVAGFGAIEGARLRLGFRQVITRPELAGLLRGGRFEQRLRARVLTSQQQHAAVELGFVQAGLQFQRPAVLRNPLLVACQEPVSQGQVEMSAVIGGVRRHGLAKRLRGGFILAAPERLQPFGREIGRLHSKKRTASVGHMIQF